MSDKLGGAKDRHLYIEGLKVDLKARAVRSGTFVIAAQATGALIGLAAIAVLARWLRPADFGLIAMALPVVVVATVLRSFGLDVGMINRDHLDSALVSSLFWVSLCLNFLMTCAVAAMAPVLAWFYGEPRLVGITLALALGVFFLSVGAQHETLLKRQMRFDLLSLSGVAAAAGGALVAVIMGRLGAGYWALVFQTVVTFFIRSLLAWTMCDWRPEWSRSRAAEFDSVLRTMLASGRNLTGTRILSLASTYFDRVIVGWLGGASVLGLYENGRRLAFFAVDAFYLSLLDVAVAGFSRAGGDDARYRAFGIKAVQMVLAMILPFLAFVFVEGRPLTLLLLGPQWIDAIPFARLLALAAFAQSLTRTLSWFYLSRDETGRQIRWFAFQTTVIFAAIAFGAWQNGAIGVAWAIAAATTLLTIPAIAYALRQSPFTARDFTQAAARPVLLSLLAAAILWIVESFGYFPRQLSTHCALDFGIYAFIYVGGWLILPGGRASGRQMIRLLVKS